MQNKILSTLIAVAAILTVVFTGSSTEIYSGGKQVFDIANDLSVGGDAVVTGSLDAASVTTVYTTLDCALSTDLAYCGTVITETVDSNTAGVGGCMVLSADGHYDDCDADAEATSKARALVTATGTGSKALLLEGRLRNDAWDWTVGGDIYVSATAGALTQTAPSGSGQFVKPVGHAYSADIIEFYGRATAVIEIP